MAEMMTKEIADQTKGALQKLLMDVFFQGADNRKGDGRFEKILQLIASECPYGDAVNKYSDKKDKSGVLSSKVALTERSIQPILNDMQANESPEIMLCLQNSFDTMFKNLKTKNSDLNKALEEYLKICDAQQGIKDGSADAINAELQKAAVGCVKGFLVGMPAGPAALITGGITAAFVVGGIARAKYIDKQEKKQSGKIDNLHQDIEKEICRGIAIIIRLQANQKKFAKHKELLKLAATTIESGIDSDTAKSILADVRMLMEYELNPSKDVLSINNDILLKQIEKVKRDIRSHTFGGGVILDKPALSIEEERAKAKQLQAKEAYLGYLNKRLETQTSILDIQDYSQDKEEKAKKSPDTTDSDMQGLQKVLRDGASKDGLNPDLPPTTVVHLDNSDSLRSSDSNVLTFSASASDTTPLTIHADQVENKPISKNSDHADVNTVTSPINPPSSNTSQKSRFTIHYSPKSQDTTPPSDTARSSQGISFGTASNPERDSSALSEPTKILEEKAKTVDNEKKTLTIHYTQKPQGIDSSDQVNQVTLSATVSNQAQNLDPKEAKGNAFIPPSTSFVTRPASPVQALPASAAMEDKPKLVKSAEKNINHNRTNQVAMEDKPKLVRSPTTFFLPKELTPRGQVISGATVLTAGSVLTTGAYFGLKFINEGNLLLGAAIILVSIIAAAAIVALGKKLLEREENPHSNAPLAIASTRIEAKGR